jgi:NDP-sugar pyrophosphorylase family protein
METQRNETREELRKKLRNKIKNKRTNNLNKKSGTFNESLNKVSKVLENTNIDSPDKIDATTIQNIMNVLNKDDLEIILNKVKEDSLFKDILKTVGDKYSNILGNKDTVVEQDTVVERNSVVEQDTVVERNSVVEQDTVVEQNSIVEQDTVVEQNSIVEQNTLVERNSVVEQ